MKYKIDIHFRLEEVGPDRYFLYLIAPFASGGFVVGTIYRAGKQWGTARFTDIDRSRKLSGPAFKDLGAAKKYIIAELLGRWKGCR